MIACPNINTKEWKSLEGALGENRAYLAYFRANKGDKTVSTQIDTSDIEIESPTTNPDNYESDYYGIRINGQYAGEFSIAKRHGYDPKPPNEIGFISGSIGSAGVELDENFRGKGYGTKIYIALAKKLAEEGYTVKSESLGKRRIGEKANNVWQSLLNKGYATDRGSYFEITNLNPKQSLSSKEPRIPTVEEGKELIKGNQTVEQSILKELQHYGMIAKRQYKSKLKKFRGKVLFSIPKIRTVSNVTEYIGLESNAVLFKRNQGKIDNLRSFNMSWFTMERTKNADFLAVDEDIYEGRRTIDVQAFNSDDTQVDSGDYMNYLQWWHSLSKDQKMSENALRAQEGLDELPIEERFQKESFIQETESVNKTQRKIDVMTQVLKSRGIDVQVRMNTSLNQKGKFTKEDGNNVIVLNPNKLSPDTAIHEFAHIFIEELGGLDNQRIRSAVQRLRTTVTYEKVKELYPELSQEELDKEVLATAMGLEGAELFEKGSENIGWWESTKQWFYNLLAKRLGFKQDAVKQLTLELIGQSQYETKAGELAYEKRDFSSEIKDVNDAMRVIINDLKVRAREMKRIDGKEAYIVKLEKMRKEIEKYYKNYDASVALAYIEEAASQLAAARKELLKDTVSLSRIHLIQTYVSSYEMLGQVKKVLNKQNFDKETKDKINETVLKANQLLEEVNDIAVKKRKDAVVEEFSRTSLYGMAQLQKQYEIEANELYSTESKSIRKELRREYVNKKLAGKEQEAYEINRKYFSKMVEFTNADIRSSAAWLSDPANTSSATLSLTTRMLDSKDAATRAFYLSERERIHKAVHKYYKARGKKYKDNPFDNLITTDSEGNRYLFTGYSPKMLEDYNKVVEETRELKIESSKIWEDLGDTYKTTEESINNIKKTLGIEELSDSILSPPTTIAKFLDQNYKFLQKYSETISNSKKEKIYNYLTTLQEAHNKAEQSSKAVEKSMAKEKKWFQDNTNKDGSPIDKWKDNKKLSEEEKELLEVFKESFIKMDTGLPMSKRLTTNLSNHTFIKLPAVTQSFYESTGKEIRQDVANSWDRAWKVQADEEELGQLPEDISEFRRLGLKLVETDIGFTEKKAIPVHFRGKIDPKKQSTDVASMIMLNIFTTENYRQKKSIEPMLYAITDVSARKKIGRTSGFSKLLKVSSSDMQRQLDMEGIDSQEYKALQSTIDVRVYGQHLREIGDVMFGVPGEKLVQNIEKYTSHLFLGLNYTANIVNIMQGKTMQLVEAISDQRYTAKDFKEAEKAFLKDMVGKDSMISDFGKLDKSSKTWKMIETLNLFGDYGTKERFSQESWKKQLANIDTIHIGQNMGELYIHGSLAYMILGGNKIMNAKREFLNKEGKVVDKKDAASLLDVMEFENGQMKFKHAVYSTLNNRPVNTLEGVDHVGATIKNLAADLYGQYDSNMKSMAQTYWWGRLGMGLRKWLVRGFNRRWRGAYTINRDERDIDKTFNEQTGEFEEGTYVTALKYVFLLKRSVDSLADLINGHAINRTWNTLSEYERRNIWRTMAEFGFMASSYLVSGIMQGLADEADDETKQLWYHVAYAHRRLYSELRFYTSVGEAQKIIRSPFASLSAAQKFQDAFGQVVDDLTSYPVDGEFDRYQTGYRRGEFKSWEKIKNAVPALNYVDDLSRVEEKLRYMSSYRGF
jgi:GNAT superfamily N-acetyltransferase